MKFKKITSKASKAMSSAAKAATPLAYAVKYNKEIQQGAKMARTGAKYAAKGAKFLKNHAGDIQDAVSQMEGGGGLNPNVKKMLIDASIGYAKKKGEAYLDKKLGKYKAYRIAKAGIDAAYNVGTGNYAGALRSATDIYGEADPNKKRVAKVKGAVKGGLGVLQSAMHGDLAGAYGNATQVYAIADPNKKRVRKFMNVNSNYIMPSAELIGASNDLSRAGRDVGSISGRSKLSDARAIV
jgi:hypothetical protein